jgi:Ankyrin repeats (3 copies)
MHIDQPVLSKSKTTEQDDTDTSDPTHLEVGKIDSGGGEQSKDFQRWFWDFVDAMGDNEIDGIEDYSDDEEDELLYDIPRIVQQGKNKGYLNKSEKLLFNGRGWEPDCTPLHYAAAKGNVQGVEALLREPEVVINARNQDNGNTPLHFAAFEGYFEIVQLLVKAYKERGMLAEIDARDNLDMGALQYTARGPRGGIQRKYGVPKDYYMNRKVALLLIEEGANPTRLVNNRTSLVEIAAKSGNIAMVEYWIENIVHKGHIDNDIEVLERAMTIAESSEQTDVVQTLQSYLDGISNKMESVG